MNLKKRLIDAAISKLNEGVDNSKEMIDSNIVSFEQMGMSNTTPGEFSDEEITDKENLVNKANMSNDTDFASEECGLEKLANDIMDDMVDISAPDGDVASLEIVKTPEEDHHHFGNSRFAKIIESALNGKSCEKYLKEFYDDYYIKSTTSGEYVVCKANGEIYATCDTEEEAKEVLENLKRTKTESVIKSLKEAGDYAGPLDFVPDVRINVSDVVKKLKSKIGDGSEGIHVDQMYDDDKNDCYKVSQIRRDLLPNEIVVQNKTLELKDDGVYYVKRINKEFPIAQ